jgi:methionyl-tRNA synthetase
LVAIYGNFINRILVLTHKYYDGQVPIPNDLTQVDRETLQTLRDLPVEVATSLDAYRFREASQTMMKIARLGNKYLADEEPWKKIKTDPERVQTIMHTALQVAAVLSLVSIPFLPHTAEKLRRLLGLPQQANWSELSQDEWLTPGSQLQKPELLFERIDDSAIETQIEKLQNT